jgi:hypothetical protein
MRRIEEPIMINLWKLRKIERKRRSKRVSQNYGKEQLAIPPRRNPWGDYSFIIFPSLKSMYMMY